MPATFSVNIGTQYETYRKPDIVSVLRDIPDNTSKLISPRDVRDAFLTTWASSPLKQTKTSAGTEYIGIDSGNPANRDIKQKIFLGKRSFGNLDIMSESLLNSDTDIFIYNTKSDGLSQNTTKMSFLTGTNSVLYSTAPFISSEYEPITKTVNLFVRNPSNNGAVSLQSTWGNVIINGVKFPTVSQNTAATNGKILRYVGNFPNGYLKWDDSNVTISQLGATDKTTNIYGGTVSLNGYELEFVNPNMTPTAVGGVPAGFSFSSTSFNGRKWPLSEVLRKLLYPKVPPTITVSATNSVTGLPYAEIGITSSINFKWNMTIYPRNPSEYINDYYINQKNGNILSPSSPASAVSGINYGLSFSGLPGSSFTGGLANMLAGSYSSPTTTYYTFHVTDVPAVTALSYPSGFSYSATASVQHVWPMYYGFTSSNVVDTASFNAAVKSLSKYVAPYPGLSNSVSLRYQGTGYFYFIHQNSTFTTPLSKIVDPNGFVVHDISSTGFSFLSDNSRLGSLVIQGKSVVGVATSWTVYRSRYECSFDGLNNFTFKF